MEVTFFFIHVLPPLSCWACHVDVLPSIPALPVPVLDIGTSLSSSVAACLADASTPTRFLLASVR